MMRKQKILEFIILLVFIMHASCSYPRFDVLKAIIFIRFPDNVQFKLVLWLSRSVSPTVATLQAFY